MSVQVHGVITFSKRDDVLKKVEESFVPQPMYSLDKDRPELTIVSIRKQLHSAKIQEVYSYFVRNRDDSLMLASLSRSQSLAAFHPSDYLYVIKLLLMTKIWLSFRIRSGTAFVVIITSYLETFYMQ
jgi:hypothetical protein